MVEYIDTGTAGESRPDGVGSIPYFQDFDQPDQAKRPQKGNMGAKD